MGLLEAMQDYGAWYVERFGETQPAWYVFESNRNYCQAFAGCKSGL